MPPSAGADQSALGPRLFALVLPALLAVVLVGEDPASGVYVRSKGRATREARDGVWWYAAA